MSRQRTIKKDENGRLILEGRPRLPKNVQETVFPQSTSSVPVLPSSSSHDVFDRPKDYSVLPNITLKLTLQ